jgi:hypothetical protein
MYGTAMEERLILSTMESNLAVKGKNSILMDGNDSRFSRKETGFLLGARPNRGVPRTWEALLASLMKLFEESSRGTRIAGIET